MNKIRGALVIDAQLLQTTAWDRGMGHYCRALLEEIGVVRPDLEVTLILNKHLSLHNSEDIKHLIPGAKLQMLDLPTLSGNIALAKKRATKEIDGFIASSYHAATVNFLSLQLFTFDYCAAFPTNTNKMVLCYDLIPLLYWSSFSGYFAAHMYFPHLLTLLEADVIFAISETTKHQLEEQLSIEPSRVININGARISRDQTEEFEAVANNRPFILMPSADLPHKNNETAVRAFEQFNRELGNIFALVITSTITESTQDQLRCYSDNLVFTGNVNDRQLAYLYKTSHAVLFVSLVEGLGLPILEAVADDKPVVCSAIPVFQEISDSAFYYCDPAQVDSITKAIRSAVAKSSWAARHAEYKKIKQKYTWHTSAVTLTNSLNVDRKPVQAGNRPQLNVAFPHPSTTSSVLGTFMQSLLPALGESVTMNVYLSLDDYVNEALKPFFMPYLTPYKSIKELQKSNVRPAYFIDESSASTELIRAAVLNPGICFVTTSDAGQLLAQLAAAGYITDMLAEAGIEIAHNNLAGLLAEAGNDVRLLDIKKNSFQNYPVEGKDTKSVPVSSRWELAYAITEELARHR